MIHGSDDPGISLVTALLTVSNYLTWSTAVKISLEPKNKIGFNSGEIQKPDPASNEYAQWKRVDVMVKSWILGSISKDLVDSFIYCSTAQDL